MFAGFVCCVRGKEIVEILGSENWVPNGVTSTSLRIHGLIFTMSWLSVCTDKILGLSADKVTCKSLRDHLTNSTVSFTFFYLSEIWGSSFLQANSKVPSCSECRIPGKAGSENNWFLTCSVV